MTPPDVFSSRGVLNRSVARKLQRSKGIALFLDFDGTLAPIQKSPSRALLPPQVKTLLRTLLLRPGLTLAIATGRSHSDISEKVGLRGPVFISNHGFRISAGRHRWVHPAAIAALPLMRAVTRRLTPSLGSIRGTLLENKGYTISVHFRNAPRKAHRRIAMAVRRIVSPYRQQLKTTRGKKVIEVRPNVEWDKGRAVSQVLNRLGPAHSVLTVYIGDDQTDEDAFRILPRTAMAIVVGRRKTTAATLRLRNTAEVARFLATIAAFPIPPDAQHRDL